MIEPRALADLETRGRLLLALAREAVEEALGLRRYADCAEPWLREPGATFVTLRQAGRLRGCVGSVRPVRPLLDDLRANARGAACEDPRFSPLAVAELPQTAVEVSLLSALEPLPAANEEALLALLRPGVDGLLLEADAYRATFLPQVWQQVPDARDFLASLKQKAGMPPAWWGDGVQAWRYTVWKWTEPADDPLC